MHSEHICCSVFNYIEIEPFTVVLHLQDGTEKAVWVLHAVCKLWISKTHLYTDIIYDGIWPVAFSAKNCFIIKGTREPRFRTIRCFGSSHVKWFQIQNRSHNQRFLLWCRCFSVYFTEWISRVFLCHHVVKIWLGRCVSRRYWCWFADVGDCCRNTRHLHTLGIDSVAHTISLLVATCERVLTLILLSCTFLYFCLESR